MSLLPSAWRIAWEGEAVPSGAIELRLDAVPRFDATSLAFWREQLRPWGKEYPLDDAVLSLRGFPALDEIWTAWMIAWRAQHDALPAAWEAMCHYCADVRGGLWPDRVDPAVAVQSIYLAIAQHWLVRDPPDRARFLDEAFALCRHVAGRLEAGARLLDDDLFRGQPAFERYVALLAADQRLYRDDRARGRAFVAHCPGKSENERRTLPLLVLAAPRATQFKLWARRDPTAPGGEGFPLLLVDSPGDPLVVSADPVSKVQISWLAAKLDERERARGGTSSWYDGRRHGGTLVAAPTSGSVLSLDDVLACLKTELALQRVRTRSPRRAVGWAAASIAGAVAMASIAVAVTGAGHARGGDTPTGGAKGDPLPSEQVISLVDSDDGPRSLTHYALVVGVCGYTGDHELHHPCRDARDVRDTLIHSYGYSADNVLFMVDRPLPGEATAGIPTARNLQKVLEGFVARYGRNPNSTFLFYYSGHGGYEKEGGQQDFGLLEPAAFFDRPDEPLRNRGWEMDRIISDIEEEVPARHLMLLMDNCYSGWAAGARGSELLSNEVYSLWKQKATVALTAAQRGQQAWEDDPAESQWRWNGHGAFTAFVLQALQVGADGRPLGDVNHDGVITDEELAAYVIKHVPESVAAVKHGEVQVPRFFRFDEHELEHGQFLFVPARR